MKIKKVAELAFHKSTSEPEAIAAFLALRRLGDFTELKDVLSESKPIEEHISTWRIAGPDSYISRVAFYGCRLAEQIDGKCHIKENKKEVFRKQKYTVILRYSKEYSPSIIEKIFADLLD